MFRHPELDSGSHPNFQAFLFEKCFRIKLGMKMIYKTPSKK